MSKRGVGTIWLAVLVCGIYAIVFLGGIGLLVACLGLIYAIVYTFS